MQEGVPSSRGLDSSDELVKAISTKQTSHVAAGDFVDSDSFIVANPRSLLELDRPPRSIPISETGSGPSALSLGSTPGSFRSSESDPATWTLPTLPWRDWELNLDDLRVCSDQATCPQLRMWFYMQIWRSGAVLSVVWCVGQ